MVTIVCHIIGLNQTCKNIFFEKINYNIYKIIDLDNINNQIIRNQEMKELYAIFEKYKNNKNDRYKNIEKKMTLFWEESFIDLINKELSSSKKIS